MAKKIEADSGLRKGFTHQDEAQLATPVKREQNSKEQAENKEENVDKKEKIIDTTAEVAEVAETDKTAADGPALSMRGISGKIISGVVKSVKKKAKTEKKQEAKTEEVTAEESKSKATEAKVEAAKEVAKSDSSDSAEKVIDQATVKTKEAKDSKETKTTAKATVTADQKKVATSVKEIKVAEVAKSSTADNAKQTSSSKGTTNTTSGKSGSTAVKESAKNVPKTQPTNAVPNTSATKPGAQQASPATPQIKTDQSGIARQRAQGALPRATKPAMPQSKPAVGSKQRPLEDRGVTSSRYANLPRIRPQQGSYVGKNSQAPVGSRPQQGQGRSGFTSTGAGKNGGFNRGGFNRHGQGMGYNKDADEPQQKPRSQQTRRKSSGPSFGEQENRKQENRKFNNQHKDKNKHQNMRNGRFSSDDYDQENIRRTKRKEKTSVPVQRAVLTNVKLPETLTVKELAEALKKTSAEVITKLMSYGVMATLNQELNYDTAEVVASEFGIKAEQLVEIKAEDILFDESEDKPEDLKERPPVVVVMGHVDHGKTSILDYIRNAHVAKGEAGGITQHIGAYTVNVNDKQITFLDTPGHEAFTVMRARGAQVTDIAILVVAADDGVMPQTIEAINHARAAETEIIVAINKIDRPNANLDKVKQELANHNLMSSEWGGTTTIVPVSAKTGENMEELLEMVLLTAEVLELKANPDRQAKGTVIEAKLDRGRGSVATMLVQRGTLRTGDTVVVGSMIGHVRAMTNDKGEEITSAGPSTPVEILGLPEVPQGGDTFYSVQNEKVARQLVEQRRNEERERQMRQSNRVSLDKLFDQMSKGEVKDLNIIVKADVQGSVEAVKQSLEKLSNDEVQVKVIHGAVGAVTESDVRLAEVANAVIIGFNVRPAANVTGLAEESNVDIRLYRVIYEAIEDTEKALKGMLAPTYKEVVLGHAEVRETFNVSGVGTIAGCYVTDGKINRTSDVRIVRDGIVIHEGKLASLKRFKDDVKEVNAGYECGMSIERYNDIKVGDQFETFEMQEVKQD